MEPIFTNDAVVLGFLLAILAFVFVTSSSSKKGWKRFYVFFPSVLACYFFPALLNWPFALVAPEWFDNSLLDFLASQNLQLPSGASFEEIKTFLKESNIDDATIASYARESQLYFMASRYLLPASLVLLCLSIDFKGLVNLGPKALVMFFTATVGIIIGGPIALLLISVIAPDVIGGAGADDIWRGLATVAGSWIGGGANQAAMKEIYGVSDALFPSMIVVDVICANIWLGFLLYGANNTDKVDKWLKSDTSAITDLKERVSGFQASVAKIPTTSEFMLLLAVVFGAVAISHVGADIISPWMKSHSDFLEKYRLTSFTSGFFWLIVISTTVGVAISFSKYKKMEGYGASRLGTIFIYVLVATIGMKMNIGDIFNNLGLFAIGIIWMAVHVGLLLLVAKLIKAPFFFVAVGSQANVGGAASAPVVAAAFSPSLAAVGALMAVMGYALGTYGAIVCAEIMKVVATG
ncbi:MAG: DUF819 family protein [Roseivirga sp.]